jgi:predicted dehydrogenase
LGRSLDEAREFVHACSARNVLVQVAFWRRADPLLRRLADGDLARRIGALQTGFALYGNGLHNNGVHMVDLVRMLCGEIVAVQAIGQASVPPSLPIPGDIHANVALALANGATIFMSSLDFRAYREVGLDLWGDLGRLAIWQEGLHVAHFPQAPNRAMSGEREIASDAATLLPSTVGEAFWHLYDNLARALDQGEPLCSPAESALATTAAIEGIVDSLRTGTPRRLAP